MNLKGIALTISLCALAGVSAHALEVTSHNDVGTLRDGLNNRLEATSAIYKVSHDALNARVKATEDNISVIKGNGAKDKVQLWNTQLEARLDAIEATLASLNTYINTIMTNGKKNAVNKWNPEMEARFDAIEGDITNLKNKTSTAKLVYKKSISVSEGTTSAVQANDICFLSRAIFATTQDNHSHTCTIGRSSAGFTLTAATVKASTDCTMLCYDIE